MEGSNFTGENSAIDTEYADRYEREERRFVRFPLILALVGLLASPFYGVGGIISAFALATGISRIKRRKSSALKWAIVISAITIVVCLLYALAISSALIYRAYELKQAEEALLG